MLGLAKGEGCRSRSNHIAIAEIFEIQNKVLENKVTSEVCAHFLSFQFSCINFIRWLNCVPAWSANAQGEEEQQLLFINLNNRKEKKTANEFLWVSS